VKDSSPFTARKAKRVAIRRGRDKPAHGTQEHDNSVRGKPVHDTQEHGRMVHDSWQRWKPFSRQI